MKSRMLDRMLSAVTKTADAMAKIADAKPPPNTPASQVRERLKTATGKEKEELIEWLKEYTRYFKEARKDRRGFGTEE